MKMIDYLQSFIEWSNDNAGFISILLFVISVIFAWLSGIFRSIIKKPKFKIRILPGPTLCSTFTTGKKFNDYNVHRTAISIYLGISNIGSSPASIVKVWVGYHWHLKPISLQWLRYSCFWFWLKEPITSMEDFQYDFGENIKFYPFLLQCSKISATTTDTYLEVGKSVNGVVYFEQDDSWGGCFPTIRNKTVKLRVAVVDTFGRKYKKTFRSPSVSLQEAQKYNPSFGATFATLRKEFNNENNT